MLNIISAITLFIFGICMYFFIIPNQVEMPIFIGWTTPSTVPNIAVISISLFAIIQLITNKDVVDFEKKTFIRTIFFGIAGIFSVYFMEYLGFLIVAPILTVAIMYIIGERRPFFLAAGIVFAILIWFLVEVLLGRPLP